MNTQQTTEVLQVPEKPEAQAVRTKLKFGKDQENFQVELRRRVDDLFARTHGRQRDCPQMYLKTAILLGVWAATYVLLVVVARTWWQAIPLAVLLGLATAGIGFNIQHDGGHQGYSNRPWVNKLMAMTLDLIGASSYLWHWKHGVFHHTYVNIAGHDTDIDVGGLGRLSPHQPRYKFHRFQQFYLWPLYGLLAIKWHLYDDFKDAIAGRIGDHHIPRPRGWDLVVFIAGKVLFLSLAFAIPMMLHAFWKVLVCYAMVELVLGMVLSVVFQLAHCVEEADFVLPHGDPARVDNAWAIHQAQSTVDFGRNSRVLAWLLGGLNFQIEHHLFPKICHINYPAMSKVVEETCREYGVKYAEHPSFWAGVASHFRWLRRMGRPDDSLKREQPSTAKE